MRSTALRWSALAVMLLPPLSGLGCPGRDGDTSFGEEGTNPLAPPLGPPVSYGAASIFNQPVPSDSPIEPGSQEIVEFLRRQHPNGIVLTTRFWSIPACYAGADTSPTEVRLTAPWRPLIDGRRVTHIRGVPIPQGAQPDPEDDGSLAIVDEASGFEYDFWQMRQTADGWIASWGNRIPLDGDGIFPTGYSARGSGFGLLAGVLWPEELRAGRIEHKLLCTLSAWACAAGGPVPPATESDGESLHPRALPEGAVLQLDPALNLDDPSLGLTPLERTIARAMQEYGLIVGDNGGREIALQAVQMGSFRSNPYRDLITTEYVEDGYIILDHIQISWLHVLALPPQLADPPIALADESIYTTSKISP